MNEFDYGNRAYGYGSVGAIDHAITRVIDEIRPAGASAEACKRTLAARWLRAERPVGLLARAAWLLRLAREVWAR